MRKVQFGCGPNKLEGWENYDRDADITLRLPFEDSSVDFILAEHVIEHVHVKLGYAFLKEVFRILKPSGVARISIPALDLMAKNFNQHYAAFLTCHLGWQNPTVAQAIEASIYQWGHEAVYTTELLAILATNVGFSVQRCEPFISTHPELNGVDSHHNTVGIESNKVETANLEFTKPA